MTAKKTHGAHGASGQAIPLEYIAYAIELAPDIYVSDLMYEYDSDSGQDVIEDLSETIDNDSLQTAMLWTTFEEVFEDFNTLKSLVASRYSKTMKIIELSCVYFKNRTFSSKDLERTFIEKEIEKLTQKLGELT